MAMKNETEGLLLVLSGPSGAGKGTLRKILFDRVPRMAYSVSWTTREPRKNEKPGREYVFVSEETFRKAMEERAFLEWAEVHGHYYGTPKEDVYGKLRQGLDVVLEIDVQGALKVKQEEPRALLIFVLPPSKKALLERLSGRHSETAQEISLRMHNAEEEMAHSREYDYRIINEDLSKAGKELVDLVLSLRRDNRKRSGSK